MIQTFLQAHADSDCSGRDAVLRPYGSAPVWVILMVGTLAILPFASALLASLSSAWSFTAWQAALYDPQLPKALGLTFWSAGCATLLSIAITSLILADIFPGPAWAFTTRRLPAFLALPHLAFAVGFLFLIAPGGWVLRLLSPWLTGFEQPPLWLTSQDPWGLGLVAVLVLKEVPFLLWAASTQLQRPELGQRLQAQLWLAQTLGYSQRAAWWRLVAPAVWRRLFWPVFAVWAYSVSVVDVALVIGPTTPSTAAVLAYTWLQDADLATNQKGAALAWLMMLLMLGALLGFYWVLRATVRWIGRPWMVAGPPAELAKANDTPALTTASLTHPPYRAWRVSLFLTAPYLGVMAALVVGSVAGYWPFPSVWPNALSGQGWLSVVQSSSTLVTTVSLACASGATALLLAVVWLEWGGRLAPRWSEQWIYLPLVLPPLLWTSGFYQIAVWMEAEGGWLAVYASHLMLCIPYTFIALSPAYRNFDPRYACVSGSLGVPYARFLWTVKWPMLKSSLAFAAALGFAVSVAQYLPTQFMGAGRVATVTTEAVTLAAGSHRELTSAYALLQCLLPLLALALAHMVSRPRRWR